MTPEINDDLSNRELYVKENNIYVNIPKEILSKEDNLITHYIKIYTLVENLKIDINKYLFDKNSKVNEIMLMNQVLKLRKEEKLNDILPFLDIDLNKVEDKLKKLCSVFGISLEEVEVQKEKSLQQYINTNENLNSVIDNEYVNEIIQHIESNQMYSLRERSRYGSISSEYNIKSKEYIEDFNEEEKNGQYSPILVIYRPAKYDKGKYILKDEYSVYIKRQPLEALIKQERLEEKGMDYMGAITYIKLRHDLTNENLQELLAELYVYAQKKDLTFENIKLSDIMDNRVWMLADRLKKEFKELRYYHKNLTQKVKEIYDSKGVYYTQIGGKYIFNTREFLICYKTFKGKDITNKK